MILTAAAELLAGVGAVDALTMRAVADAAGVAVSSAFTHGTPLAWAAAGSFVVAVTTTVLVNVPIDIATGRWDPDDRRRAGNGPAPAGSCSRESARGCCCWGSCSSRRPPRTDRPTAARRGRILAGPGPRPARSGITADRAARRNRTPAGAMPRDRGPPERRDRFVRRRRAEAPVRDRHPTGPPAPLVGRDPSGYHRRRASGMPVVAPSSVFGLFGPVAAFSRRPTGRVASWRGQPAAPPATSATPTAAACAAGPLRRSRRALRRRSSWLDEAGRRPGRAATHRGTADAAATAAAVATAARTSCRCSHARSVRSRPHGATAG